MSYGLSWGSSSYARPLSVTPASGSSLQSVLSAWALSSRTAELVLPHVSVTRQVERGAQACGGLALRGRPASGGLRRCGTHCLAITATAFLGPLSRARAWMSDLWDCLCLTPTMGSPRPEAPRLPQHGDSVCQGSGLPRLWLSIRQSSAIEVPSSFLCSLFAIP